MKPENLLLDYRGFCKVADCGLAKRLDGGVTYTTCGTPDYFAPEVIQQKGQSLAVDWWTLGILLHEMLTAHAPFEAQDTSHTVKKILKGTARVNFSLYATKEPLAKDLVCSLLENDPMNRLPMRSGGAIWNLRTEKLIRNSLLPRRRYELMNRLFHNVSNPFKIIIYSGSHPWYANFPWVDLWEGNVLPPYMPIVKDNCDAGNFVDAKRKILTSTPYKQEGSDESWCDNF